MAGFVKTFMDLGFYKSIEFLINSDNCKLFSDPVTVESTNGRKYPGQRSVHSCT
jgi:hypothetical protein